MKISMKNGNILTELLSEQKQGGLYIPDNKAYKKAKVVSSNDESVLEGDILYVLKHVGTTIEIENKEYLVVNIRDILFIL